MEIVRKFVFFYRFTTWKIILKRLRCPGENCMKLFHIIISDAVFVVCLIFSNLKTIAGSETSKLWYLFIFAKLKIDDYAQY